MKKFAVEVTEKIRRIKTYEVIATSRLDAVEKAYALHDEGKEPKASSEMQTNIWADAWEIK